MTETITTGCEPSEKNNLKIIFTGVIRTYHDEEKTKLKEEYFICDNKKEGIYKSYHDNGQLKEEVNYIDGKKNGIRKSYHENGQLWDEVNYIDGKENGILKLYHRNGQLEIEVNYIDGKANGFINHIMIMGDYVKK